MRTRAAKISAIILAVIALGLAAFIVFYEQGMLTSGELATREGRLIEKFVRARVAKLELQRAGRTIVMERRRPPGEDEELGEWHITAPVRTKADADSVDALLGALEWLEARRSFEGINADDRRRFGLDTPRARVWFTAGRDRVQISVGRADVREEGVYVQLDDPTRAYVVPGDFPEALAHDLAHFRSKSVFAEESPLSATKITLREGEREIRLERVRERWSLTAPVRGMASMSAVNEVLRALDELRMERFVAERPGALARWGFDRPVRSANLEITVTEGEDGAQRRIVRSAMRVGGACEGHPEERYVMVGDAGPVGCVLTSRLDALTREPERLRERRLVTTEPEDVSRIVIVAGTRRLTAERRDTKFHVTAGRGTFDTMAAAAEALVRELGAVQAEGFLGASAADLAAHGLTTPAATITLRNEAGVEEVISLGQSDMSHAYVRRGEEGAILEVAASVADLFDTSGIRLLDRQLVRENDDDCKSLAIERGGVRETIAPTGNAWAVTAPVSAPADGGSVNDIVRGIGALEAVRFVAARATPAHGLATPRFVLTARFEGTTPPPGTERGKDAGTRPPVRTYTLRIGAATEGGAFATLDADPLVLVAPQALVDAIASPAISRDALSSDEGDVQRIVIERGATRVEIRREGEAWVTAEGAAANPERTRELVAGLASLRAQSVRGYGPPAATDAIATPTLRITVTRREGAPTPAELTLLVGARTGTGDDARDIVRRADLAATFLFLPAAFEPFRTYTP